MNPKAKIITVGIIVDGKPEGFMFDCQNNPGIAGLHITDSGVLFCGWSVEELREVVQRPSEFISI